MTVYPRIVKSMLPKTMASGSKAIHGRPLRAALIAAPTQIRVGIEEMTISDVLQGAVYFFMAVFFRERAMPSNENKLSYRHRDRARLQLKLFYSSKM